MSYMLFHSGGGVVVSSLIKTVKKLHGTRQLQVNSTFLPIKAVYFFFLAGNASFLPFYPVYMTYLGLSVLQVGLVRGVEPIVQLIIGPLWASLADKYSKHKTILLLSAILPVLFFFGTFFLPTLKATSTPWVPIANSTQTGTMEDIIPKMEIERKLTVESTFENTHQTISFVVEHNMKSWIWDWYSIHLKASSSTGLIFGLMMMFSFLANVFFCPFFPILDSATMRLVQEQDDSSFGQQRMWGAISWGIFATVSGLAIDNYPDHHQRYAPAFYLFAGFSVLTFFIALRINFTPHQSQSTVWRRVGSLFSNPYFVLFQIASFICGLSMGILSYLFIYLEKLHGSHLLMGLTTAITCSTETPVMYFSNLMIGRLGHRAMLCMIVLCYGVRLMCYSFLHNPWFVLPIELMHGFTFGAFRPTATSYVNVLAPAGLEASVQGITYGMFSGLGRGVGILVGGIVFHIYGGRNMFRASALVCGITLLGLCLAYTILARKERIGRQSVQYDEI